jgi:hypothetical protein
LLASSQSRSRCRLVLIHTRSLPLACIEKVLRCRFFLIRSRVQADRMQKKAASMQVCSDPLKGQVAS